MKNPIIVVRTLLAMALAVSSSAYAQGMKDAPPAAPKPAKDKPADKAPAGVKPSEPSAGPAAPAAEALKEPAPAEEQKLDACAADPQEWLKKAPAGGAWKCLLSKDFTLDVTKLGKDATGIITITFPAKQGFTFDGGPTIHKRDERFTKLVVDIAKVPEANGGAFVFGSTSDKAWSGVSVSIAGSKNGVELALTRPAGDGKPSGQNEERQEKKDEVRKCSSEDFVPAVGSEAETALEKACRGKLCITPSGMTYGVNRLSDDLGALAVELWVPHSDGVTYSLDVSYEKIVLKNSGNVPLKDARSGAQNFTRVADAEVLLTGAGKLHVTVEWKAGAGAQVTPPSGSCVPDSAGKLTKTFPVSGRYFFMLGFMPTYAGLYERTHTLHRSDDGVQRLFEQDVQEIDYTATLSAFPGGVDEDKQGAALGFLLGTSITNPGRRWYLGAQLSTPINIGLVAGAGLIVVDELDRDFEAGQPLEDTNFPTHSTVVPTWFLGVNIEAELFKKAFKGIAGDDD
jgi:hypothetical protein